jgi:hypothetical protein
MSIIPTSLGNPQCTDVAVESELPFTGNATRQDLQSTLSQNDAEVSKLYEDRNVQLTQGGSISYDSSGTFLTLSENLNLEINSQVAGGNPTIIPIFSGSPPYTINVSASGNLGYAVIDRIGGTATYYDNQTSLPAVVYANQEVFLIGKRDDSGDAMMRFYFRDGTAITAGQSIRLGAPSGFSLQFFASNPVNTASSTLSSSSFTTFSNSPAFTFTPTVSGNYKVYTSAYFIIESASGSLIAQIHNTSGGATLLYNSQAYFNISEESEGEMMYFQAVYTLTAGSPYVFDIQGNTSTSNVVMGTSAMTFYMFAELVG